MQPRRAETSRKRLSYSGTKHGTSYSPTRTGRGRIAVVVSSLVMSDEASEDEVHFPAQSSFERCVRVRSDHSEQTRLRESSWVGTSSWREHSELEEKSAWP